MAKNSNTKTKVKKGKMDISIDEYLRDDNIIDVEAGENCTSAMTIFMINNNYQRMIPEYKDSLKPVNRRILLSLLSMKTRYNYQKVSSIVGETMHIHPHGDMSIYSSIVNMAQPWKNNICLVQGKGNYGNVQGDGAAAPRYINAKLSDFAWDCFFEEYSKYPNMVDKNPKTGLPEYFPSKYPIIFLNGSLGIGSGYKTDIPPFNFKDICETTIKLIKNNEAKFMIYPDMPIPCDILDKEKFADIYKTGRGSFRTRGRAEIENRGIRILSVPYNVDADKIVDEIKKLVVDKKITTITDLKNYTSENNVDIYLPLSRGADPHKTLDQLYRYTSLQSSFTFGYTILDGLEFITDMKDVIRNTLIRWTGFRRFSILRKLQFEIKELRTRIHILEALIKMLEHPKFTKIMSDIKKIKGGKEAVVKYYINEFKITDLQATLIASMAIYELSYDYLPKYKDELALRMARANELRDIFLNDTVNDIMIKELEEGIAKYGRPRNCRVLSRKDELGLEDTQHSILITAGNYIKKLADVNDTEFGVFEKVDGRIDTLVVAKTNVNNMDEIYLFTKLGKVHKFPIYQIPVSLKTNSGITLNSYCKLDDGDSIVSAYTTTELELGEDIYFVSNCGNAKKIKASDFIGSTAKTTAKLKKGEVLVGIELGMPHVSMAIVYTDKVMRRCCDIPEYSRNAQGKEIITEPNVKGITLVYPRETMMLVIDSRNKVKKINISKLPKSKKNDVITLTSGDDAISKCYAISNSAKYNLIINNEIQELNPNWIDCSTILSKPSETLAKVKDTILGIERV